MAPGGSRHLDQLRQLFAQPNGPVIFAGAGVSLNATGGDPVAGWRGLLQHGYQRCVEERGVSAGWRTSVAALLEEGDLDTAAHKIVEALDGREGGAFATWLADTVGQLRVVEPAWPRALAETGLPLVTTNYDDVLSSVAGRPVVTRGNPAELEAFVGGEREAVWHLHGHWREAPLVVLGLESYFEVLRDRLVQHGLHTLLGSRRALFVGYGEGLGDPHFESLRRWMSEVMGFSSREHYVLVCDGELEEARVAFGDVARLVPLSYGADHSALPNFLASLRPAPVEPAAPADFETELAAYVTAAEDRHQKFDVLGCFGTRVNLDASLEDLHVPLRAVVDERVVGYARYDSAADADRKLVHEGEEPQAGCEEIDLADVFRALQKRGSGIPGFVLLGDPGSGKTTHLKQLLLWLLRNGDPEQLGLPPGTVPVLLPLHRLDLPADLDRDLDDVLDRELPGVRAGFAARLRAVRPVLYLLDGLDEVPDVEQRAAVSRWIEEAVRGRTAAFAVTCRYAGYREEAQLTGGLFLELHLRPLNREQIEALVHGWYRLRESVRTRRSGSEPTAAELLARLDEPAFRAGRGGDFAGNPLLLTALCLVHMESEGGLPLRRVDLYERCVDVLLQHWVQRRVLRPTLDVEQARAVLGAVAHWLHQEESRERASTAELRPAVRKTLKRLELSGERAEELLQAVRDESGLLTGWSGEHYGLLHLGFQEYLTAWEIQRRSRTADFRKLAQRCGESWWREVVLLQVGMDRPERFLRLAAREPGFGADGTLVDWILIERPDLDPELFLEPLREEWGDDPARWRSQLACLLAAERLAPAEVRRLAPRLKDHPLWEIHGRFRPELEELEIVVHEPSGCELVRIPGGRFLMGSLETEEGRSVAEGPQHEVSLGPFYLARHPVTNREFGRYLRANPNAPEPAFWQDPQLNQPWQPVVGVSWDDSRAYCRWAGLVLPTESQWEYACRARTTTRFWSGDREEDLASVGWYQGNSESRVHSVAEKPPNSFGLYDVHGNVDEWCQDEWSENYSESKSTHPDAYELEHSRFRMFRGGYFSTYVELARSAFRIQWLCGSERVPWLGFRPARLIT